MQQRRIHNNYPTLSGEALRVPTSAATAAMELRNCRIQRTELEQQDPQHPALQALDAAIRTREQQLARARAEEADEDFREMSTQASPDSSSVVRFAGTFRTVDMTMREKPIWNSVAAKMHYLVIFHDGSGGYRVFAQTKTSIRHRQWKQLFDAYGLLSLDKIDGFFEDCKAYKQRLSQPHTILEEHGPRPVRLARTSELEAAQNTIRELKDENLRLRVDRQQESEMNSADEDFICTDARDATGVEQRARDDSSDSDADDAEMEEYGKAIEAASRRRARKRPRLEDEQLAAKAAEVRAAMVVAADAAVVARAAELALVTARKDMSYGKNVSSSEQSVLEQSVRQAQDEEKVAKARLSLLRAELKAAQLK